MGVRPETRSRTRMGPAVRRRSPCYRHPEESITGICASCLRERLSGLDVSVAAEPELRRCRSVVLASKCGGSSFEPRRNSCDVMSARGSLCEFLGPEDLRNGSESEPRVDWRNAGLARETHNVIESKAKRRDRVKGFGDRAEVLNTGRGYGNREDEEGEFKTMKEFIDLEISKKKRISKDLKAMAGNLLGAASIVGKKLLKWKKNNKEMMKKPDNSIEKNEVSEKSRNIRFFHYRQKLRESHSPIVGGRRSCDAGSTAFPLDAGRISLDQPRSSWDGYMIARSIPTLAPMFSVVDNGILGNARKLEKHGLSMEGAMHSIAEDKSSSGASGSSNSTSDSSSSMRWSSFDRSTSVRSSGKKAIGYEDCGDSSANVKLVITEKELKDWNLSSRRDKSLELVKTASSSNAATDDSEFDSSTQMQKPITWRTKYKTLGFRSKNNESFSGIGFDHPMDHKGNVNSWRIDSMSSFDFIEPACSRRSVDGICGCELKSQQDIGFKRNNSAKHSSVFIDTSFYSTPHRNRRFSNDYRNSKDYIAGASFLLN